MAAVSATKIIAALAKGGREALLELLESNKISANKALQMITGRRVPISDAQKVKIARILLGRDLPGRGLGSPTGATLTALKSSVGHVEDRTRVDKLINAFKTRAKGPQRPKTVVPPRTSTRPPTAVPASAASDSVSRAQRSTGADPKRLSAVLRRLVGERNEAVGASAKAAESTAKAQGPRFGRAGLLLGAGAFFGLRASGGGSDPATSAALSELFLNQGTGVDRQGLIAAQEELTKARTAQIIQRLLEAQKGGAPAIPFS